MKKVDSFLRDYAAKLPFDNLKWLVERFKERIGPDLSEAIDFVAKNPDVDKLLGAAKNYEEFWNAVDLVGSCVEKELNRRVPDLVSHS